MALTTLENQVETLLPPIPDVPVPVSTEEIENTSDIEAPVTTDAEELFVPSEEPVEPTVSEVDEDVEVADLKISSEPGSGPIAHDHAQFKKDMDAFIASKPSETEASDSDSDFLEYAEGYFDRVGTTYGNVGKSVVYGLGKTNILGLIELAPLVAEYGVIRAPNAVYRTVVEGLKATARAPLYEEWEVYLSELVGGEKGLNMFSYEPILNTQDDIDNFLFHQIPALLNAGLDVAASLGYTPAKGVDVREFPTEYKKFADRAFKAYEVPEDQRSIVTDFTKLFSSIIGPYATFKRVMGRDTVEFVEKQYLAKKKQYTSMKDELEKLIIKRNKQGKTIVSKKSVVRQDRLKEQSLRKAIPIVKETLAPLLMKSRYYGRANRAVPLYKKFNKGIKIMLKDEALVAGIAAGTMMTTENLMQGTSLEEYKSLSFLPALVVAPFAPALLVQGFGSVQTIHHTMMGHFEGAINGNTDKARHHVLRSKKYSVEQINKMDYETQVKLAIQDEAALKRAREVGEYLTTLRKSNDPNDVKMYEDIASAINVSSEKAKLLSRDLRDDVENGFLDSSDVKHLADSFPILIDQVALLSGLQTAKAQILQAVQGGGFMRAKKLLMLNDLDRIQVILDQQTTGLAKSLKGIKNRLNTKLGGAETEQSTAGILYSNLKGEVDRIQGSGLIAKEEITLLKNSSLTVAHPSNTAEVRKATNDLFGSNETNPTTWAETGKTPLEAEELSSSSLKAMGENQAKIINQSLKSMTETNNANYDAAFSSEIELSADQLLIDHSAFLENHLDSVKIFKPILGKLESQEERLIQVARRRGLQSEKDSFAGNSEQYFNSLKQMSIRFDNVLTPNKNHADTISQYNQDYLDNPAEAIKSLEKELLKRPFFTDVDGKKVIKSVNSDGVEDMIIPTTLTVTEIHKLRSAIMSTHYNKKTSGNLDVAQARFAQSFDRAVTTLFEGLEKQAKKTDTSEITTTAKLATEQRELIKKANDFYKNTLGKTYNQRLGEFVKSNSVETEFVPIKNMSDLDELFDSFIKDTGSGYTQKAEQFKIMFSKLDETGNPIPDTLDPQAVNLLKQAVRRYIVKGEGNELGLKSLTKGFVDNFLIASNNSNSINILKDSNKSTLNTFFGARQAESTVDYGKAPFKEHAETLEKVFTSLSIDKKEELAQSLFGDVIKAGTDYDKLFNLFIKGRGDLFKADQNFHYGREPLAFYKQRYEASGSPEDFEIYTRLREQERVIKDPMTKKTLEVAGVDSKIADNVLETVGPQIRIGASEGKSPITILLEVFEDAPKAQREEVRNSLKGMFTEYVSDSAFSFTDNVSYMPKDLVSTSKTKISKGDITLGQSLDIKEFASILNKNQNALKILWQDDPEQLARIERIFDLAVITKGTPANKARSGEVGSIIAPGSAISRVYSISRGVVSPRYVATEIAIKQAQITNSNSILQTIMDPDTTKIVDTVLQDVKVNSVTNETVKKVRDLGLTFFFLQMGEDDPTTIKDEAWIRTRLEFLARGMRASDYDMEENTMSLEEDGSPAQEDNTLNSFGETFSLD
tara:strand:+ start:2174 stop:6808 length:4635 start_codon:yes stop_codon:yes gene_type:complete